MQRTSLGPLYKKGANELSDPAAKSEVQLTVKQCNRCGVAKQASDFGKNRRRADGLAAYCKVCFAEISTRSYRKRQRQKGLQVRGARSVPEGFRWCPDCDNVKPQDQFPRHGGNRSGYGNHCKEHH